MWRKQSEFEEAHAPVSDTAKPGAGTEAPQAGLVDATIQVQGGAPAADAAAPDATDPAALREAIVDQLKTVFDPEIPVNIYELGLIYDVDVAEDGKTKIRMTLTTPMCPAAEELPPEVETKARGVPGVTGVELDLVWDPPWNPDMMSEAARLELGMV